MHDFNELCVFAAVVEQGGLSAVSQCLDLPKSTLSRRISQLESRVGQRLLLRLSNRMVPTEAGNLFYSYCCQMIELARLSQLSLDELRDDVSGHLTLHLHPAFEHAWMPSWIVDFLTLYPAVNLELKVESQVPEGQGGASDLWLWLGAEDTPGLRSDYLGAWPTALYASPHYMRENGQPQVPEDLSAHTWVLRPEDGVRQIKLHNSQAQTYAISSPSSRIKTNTLLMQAACIADGQGIGILPIRFAKHYQQSHPDSLSVCLEGWLPDALPLSLHYSFGRPSRKVEALKAWLQLKLSGKGQT